MDNSKYLYLKLVLGVVVDPKIEICKALRLESLKLKEDDCRMISQILKTKPPNSSPLQELYLNKNGLGVKEIKIILQTFLGENKNYPPPSIRLSYLNLSQNRLGDEGVKHVAEKLKWNKTLKILILDDNQITDKGAAYLANALISNNTLTELSLQNNKIGRNAASSFTKLFKKNQTLRTLLLTNNQIEMTIGVTNSANRGRRGKDNNTPQNSAMWKYSTSAPISNPIINHRHIKSPPPPFSSSSSSSSSSSFGTHRHQSTTPVNNSIHRHHHHNNDNDNESGDDDEDEDEERKYYSINGEEGREIDVKRRRGNNSEVMMTMFDNGDDDDHRDIFQSDIFSSDESRLSSLLHSSEVFIFERISSSSSSSSRNRIRQNNKNNNDDYDNDDYYVGNMIITAQHNDGGDDMNGKMNKVVIGKSSSASPTIITFQCKSSPFDNSMFYSPKFKKKRKLASSFTSPSFTTSTTSSSLLLLSPSTFPSHHVNQRGKNEEMGNDDLRNEIRKLRNEVDVLTRRISFYEENSRFENNTHCCDERNEKFIDDQNPQFGIFEFEAEDDINNGNDVNNDSDNDSNNDSNNDSDNDSNNDSDNDSNNDSDNDFGNDFNYYKNEGNDDNSSSVIIKEVKVKGECDMMMMMIEGGDEFEMNEVNEEQNSDFQSYERDGVGNDIMIEVYEDYYEAPSSSRIIIIDKYKRPETSKWRIKMKKLSFKVLNLFDAKYSAIELVYPSPLRAN